MDNLTQPQPFTSTAYLVVRACFIFLIVIVWAQVSATRGLQVTGIVIMIQALAFMIYRSIPYGWRGAPPSGSITGYPALFLSLVWCVIGLALVIHSDNVLSMVDSLGRCAPVVRQYLIAQR